jgi:Holliday junction resolvasome RuvABC ATP-dependent DNA helicase subunit
MGNLDTGKTSVAKIFEEILRETSARENNVFVETNGEELARMGADKALELTDSAMGGVLFVDEAYFLEPAANADGKAAVMQLLKVAEERRKELTNILAGHKDDIESKLFAFNDGFTSRFNFQIAFEDYTEQELAEIFGSMCMDTKWLPERDNVVNFAARHLVSGRGARRLVTRAMRGSCSKKPTGAR